MRLNISHDTFYSYEQPVRSIVQVLRLTPRDHDGQHSLSWRIEPDVDGMLRVDEDGLGNIIHVFAAEGPVEALTIRVRGVVETTDTTGIVTGCVERAPDLFFLRDTPLTDSDDRIRGFAKDHAAELAGDRLATLHRLLDALSETMTFDRTASGVGTNAIEAFAAGRGVCQDFTHVFIAAARHLGIPTRYVSGYVATPDGGETKAGHAWAEAWVPGLGWVGFDAANGLCPNDGYVRVAIGLDYLGAAPVRGSRRGGGAESLDVKLRVDTAQRQSQN